MFNFFAFECTYSNILKRLEPTLCSPYKQTTLTRRYLLKNHKFKANERNNSKRQGLCYYKYYLLQLNRIYFRLLNSRASHLNTLYFSKQVDIITIVAIISIILMPFQQLTSLSHASSEPAPEQLT